MDENNNINFAPLNEAPASANLPEDSTVPADIVGNNAGFKFPTAPVQQTPDISSIPTFESILGQTTPEDQQAEQQGQDISGRIEGLLGKLRGRETEQIAAEEEVGLPGFEKDLLEVNSQIQALQKESLAIPMQLQEQFKGRGVTEAGLAPIEASALRKNAIQALGLSAISQTLQGNVALAQQQADKAIEAEFRPIEVELAYQRELYDMNKDVLDRIDKNRSEKMKVQLAERTRLLSEAKESKETGIALASVAIQNNPGNKDALAAAQQVMGLNVNDPGYLQKVIALVGQYQTDPIAVDSALLDLQAKFDEAALAPLRRKKLLAEIAKEENDSEGSGEQSFGLVQAVIDNPELFNQLTATEKGKISPMLSKLGFTSFGKPLSNTAIKDITQTETALEGIKELKDLIAENEQYIGPIKGLQAYNPFSKSRQIQADVDRIRQRVGKALEGGVLRKEDEEKYKKILAVLTDTPETAAYKINQLIVDLNRELSTYKKNQALAGRNVPEATVEISLRDSVAKAGYDYEAMKADGFTDEEIRSSIE